MTFNTNSTSTAFLKDRAVVPSVLPNAKRNFPKRARTTVARIVDASSSYVDKPNPTHVDFQKPKFVAEKRWLCNVASTVKLSKHVERGLNIDSLGKYSQYELMVKLLKAETCDVIYFDCQLSASQIGILKMLQVFSRTELVHARLAMQFDRAMG